MHCPLAKAVHGHVCYWSTILFYIYIYIGSKPSRSNIHFHSKPRTCVPKSKIGRVDPSTDPTTDQSSLKESPFTNKGKKIVRDYSLSYEWVNIVQVPEIPEAHPNLFRLWMVLQKTSH